MKRDIWKLSKRETTTRCGKEGIRRRCHDEQRMLPSEEESFIFQAVSHWS